MGEAFYVRTTRGKRASFRKTPSGNHYVFYRNAQEGKWLKIDPSANIDSGFRDRAKIDLDYFKSDDLFEVRGDLVAPKKVILQPKVEKPEVVKAEPSLLEKVLHPKRKRRNKR